MLRGIPAALVAVAVASAGCQTAGELPWSVQCLSPQAEALAGQRAAPALEKQFGGVDADPAAAERLGRIGTRLAGVAPQVPGEWHFRLLASEKINAFALAGGRVYVTRGLHQRIGDHDRLLAAVIAHEMAHVIRKDSLKPPCGCVKQALEREKAADRLGARCLAAAGYPGGSMTDLLRLTEDVHPTGWVKVRIRALAELRESSPGNHPSRTLAMR